MQVLKIKKHFLFLFIAGLFSVHCFAQDDKGDEKQYPQHDLTAAPPATEEIFYRGSIQIGGGIMYAITNKALRSSLGGEYSGHCSGNFVIAPHIYTGLELEWAQFGNTSFVANASTIMSVFNAGVKIGYYTFMQKDFLFCYSLSGGPSLVKYSHAILPSPKGGFQVTSFFVAPNMFIGYRVNNELRIGLDLTFNFMGYHFDPTLTGLDQTLPGYTDAWSHDPTMYFQWGFGLYWAFAEGKRK